MILVNHRKQKSFVVHSLAYYFKFDFLSSNLQFIFIKFYYFLVKVSIATNEKRLERIPFVIDIFPLSFFILTISLGNFPSVLLHYFVRGYISNVLQQKEEERRVGIFLTTLEQPNLVPGLLLLDHNIAWQGPRYKSKNL